MATVLENDKGRFIVSGPFDEEMPYFYIIIADFAWWHSNERKIFNWMDQCLPRGRHHLRGMVLELDNEELASLFLLKWQE